MRRRSANFWLSVLAAAATSLCLTSCDAAGEMPQPSVSPSTIGRGDLLYVATGDNVYALSYPNGKLAFNLGISGYGLCSDAKGDVFVPRGSSGRVDEYSHDGRLIERLRSGDFAFSCAVDPSTGNLAVPTGDSAESYVVIYPHASTKGEVYADATVGIWGSAAYDDAGNLFVDGLSSKNVLAELKRGGSKLANHTLGKPFGQLDSLQGYRSSLAIPNSSTDAIYQVEVVRGVAKIRGTCHVNGWSVHSDGLGVQTWLHDGAFIGQSGSGAELGIWRYPKGGAPTKVLGPFLSGNVRIDGIVVSRASR